MFTVKQLSQMAGITPRTLHHYDAIGLLKPSHVGRNGYRYYDESAVLRMQQILFFREMDMPLKEIKNIVGRPDFDVLDALHFHKQSLGKRAARIQRLLTTVDKTIRFLEGENAMKDKSLFEGFSEEEQEKYAQDAEQMYDPETVRASNRKWKGYSEDEKKKILEEGKQVYMDLLAAMPEGAASPEVQACIQHWRNHMDYFWTPSLDQLIALADGYNSDPRFKANFDKLDPRLAEFMRVAVVQYVHNQKR